MRDVSALGYYIYVPVLDRGNLPGILFDRNKDHKLAFLSLKLLLNSGDLQNQESDRFQPISHEFARQVDTYQLTT